jgi:hypothetical protein
MQPTIAADAKPQRTDTPLDRLGVRHIGEIVPAVLARYSRELEWSHETRAMEEDPPSGYQEMCTCTEGDHVSAFTESIGRHRD